MRASLAIFISTIAVFNLIFCISTVTEWFMLFDLNPRKIIFSPIIYLIYLIKSRTLNIQRIFTLLTFFPLLLITAHSTIAAVYLFSFMLLFLVSETHKKCPIKNGIYVDILVPIKNKDISTLGFYKMLSKLQYISLEIYATHNEISFHALISKNDFEPFKNSIEANFIGATIIKSKKITLEEACVFDLKLASIESLPIDTQKDMFQNLLRTFSSLKQSDEILIEYLYTGETDVFKERVVKSMIEFERIESSYLGKAPHLSHEQSIKSFEKSSQSLGGLIIRVGVKSTNIDLLNDIAKIYSGFNGLNGFKYLDKPTIIDLNSRAFWDDSNVSVVGENEMKALFTLPDSKDFPKTIYLKKENLPADKVILNSDGVIIGRNNNQNVCLSSQTRSKHTYIVGKTGMGKSTLIQNMIIQDIQNHEGVALIDPHGDIVTSVLGLIPKDLQDEIIYIDPTIENPYSFNLLDKEFLNDLDISFVVDNLISIFKNVFSELSIGPQTEDFLRFSIQTLIEAGGYTLLEVYDLLTNEIFREGVLRNVHDPIILKYWQNYRMDKRTDELLRPVLNKIGRLRVDHRIRRFIGQTSNSIDLYSYMNNQKILLINLSDGKLGMEMQKLIGSLFMTYFEICAKRRESILEDKRVPFYLYVDEFQNFANESFCSLLSQSRKYKLYLTIANQFLTQIPSLLQDAILGNVNTIISFKVSVKTARLLEREFEIEYLKLTHLNSYQAYVHTSQSEPLNAFTIDTLSPILTNVRESNLIINKSKSHKSIDEIEDEIIGRTQMVKPLDIFDEI